MGKAKEKEGEGGLVWRPACWLMSSFAQEAQEGRYSLCLDT